MTNMLQAGIDWLSAQLQASASVSITYTRGATSIILDATPGATDWAAMSEYAVVNAWVSRDYIFPISELDTLTSPKPQQGDRITEVGDDGVTRSYDVLAPSGAQPYRLMGPARTMVRVHTRLVGET